MKTKWMMTGTLAALVALPLLAAPLTASASCGDRKLTGTVVGGLGGALVGNSISRGGGGAVVGGLGGAVLGHEVARGSCGDERRVEYRQYHHRRHHHRHHDGDARGPY